MIRKTMFAASVLVAFALITASAAGQSGAQPQAGSVTVPVQVINTPNVNVANTPSVHVTNTPSVDIANTPTVTLSNGTSVAVISPLDARGNPTPLATLEAVQVYGSACAFFFGDNSSGSCDFTTVPQGKQLVVEEFDALGIVEAGNRPLDLVLNHTVAGGNFFPYAFQVNANGIDFLATHQQTRVYVAQGQTPSCYVSLPANSIGEYICRTSGFLVDMPPGEQGIMVQQQQPLPQLPRRLPGR